MYQNIHDPIETLGNELCSAVGKCVIGMEFSALSTRLCDVVMQEVKEEMGEWGIEIVSLNLINLSRARPIRLIIDRPMRLDRFA
jgi:hypothetical protein